LSNGEEQIRVVAVTTIVRVQVLTGTEGPTRIPDQHIPHRVYVGVGTTGPYYLPRLRAHAADRIIAERDVFFLPEVAAAVVLF
jgi:hypothetical protein